MAESINQRLNQAGLQAPSYQELQKLLQSALTDLAALKTQFNQLRTDYNAHTHSGVTTGAGASGAPSAATTATAVSLNTTE